MLVKDVIPVYLKHLKTLGRSDAFIKNVKYGLGNLNRFLENEGIYHIEDLTFEIFEDYSRDLAFYLTKKGKLMEIESQGKILSMVKGFTRYLKEKDYLVSDPAQRIKLPKTPMRLPKVILSKKEIKTLLAAQDIRTNTGYRDRIILEILYDTAIRRFEVAGIKLTDLDLEAGYIRIKGKGSKQRVVPLSRRVCALVRNYILFIRPSFIKDKDKGYLIAGRWGGKINLSTINDIVRECARCSGIKKRVTTHTLRHTCATHMLKNGAPIRHIQEMLGHACIETTQVYTRVTINDLKEIHARYHPSGTLQEKPK
jgi:integrase/recombinase XerD